MRRGEGEREQIEWRVFVQWKEQEENNSVKNTDRKEVDRRIEDEGGEVDGVDVLQLKSVTLVDQEIMAISSVTISIHFHIFKDCAMNIDIDRVAGCVNAKTFCRIEEPTRPPETVEDVEKLIKQFNIHTVFYFSFFLWLHPEYILHFNVVKFYSTCMSELLKSTENTLF